MPRPIQATIHTAALRHNLERMRRAAPDAKVWAVVKANAYGHGIERVFDGLRGADGFALLDLDEAQRVRALGWSPAVGLQEGLARTVEWYRNNRAWWEPIRSGEYRSYYERHYGRALAGG